MIRPTRLIGVLCAWALLSAPAHAGDAALFRLFLVDGTPIVSYGEFARLDDLVVFSMPAGGDPDRPRLHLVSLPSALIDWARTDRYAASLRYQRYAATQGEADFDRLSSQVAAALSTIALSTDRARALAIAEEARRTLADWPRTHFGYRQDDVRDIVQVLDEAINALRGQTDAASFDLSLVATAPPVEVEPVLGMPSPADQLAQLLHVSTLASRASDRVTLLQSALALVAEAGAAMVGVDSGAARRSIDRRIRDEAAVDARYADLAAVTMRDAARASADARVAEVERLLERIPRDDARLGGRRPEVVQALHAAVQRELDRARLLRLRRDRWELRRPLYDGYQRSVRAQLVTLIGATPAIEAIRNLEGPAPERLVALRAQLQGGASRLERLLVPDDLRATHDLFVSAWRLAERAANARHDAVVAGSLDGAWTASAAAAGSLMLVQRVREHLIALSEPPTLDDLESADLP